MLTSNVFRVCPKPTRTLNLTGQRVRCPLMIRMLLSWCTTNYYPLFLWRPLIRQLIAHPSWELLWSSLPRLILNGLISPMPSVRINIQFTSTSTTWLTTIWRHWTRRLLGLSKMILHTSMMTLFKMVRTSHSLMIRWIKTLTKSSMMSSPLRSKLPGNSVNERRRKCWN